MLKIKLWIRKYIGNKSPCCNYITEVKYEGSIDKNIYKCLYCGKEWI